MSSGRRSNQGHAASQSQSSQYTEIVPAAFTHEYRLLIEVCESLNSGFVLLNAHERVVYSNSSVQRLLQFKKSNVGNAVDFDVRKHLLTLVADPQIARPELERIWSRTEQEYVTDLALADAAVRWLRVRAFPVRDSKGLVLGRGILFDDVTLERATIEAQSETLALAAHELRTPLAVIKGCATTLLGNTVRWDPTMQREMLQMIDTQSDRLYDVINTLLDVWRLDAGTQPLHLVHVSLPDLIQQLIARLQRQATAHTIHLDAPPILPQVLCDPIRIEMVINHLLKNAIAYAPTGTTIQIRLEANDLEVRVAITDQGIGIASEHLDRIFDRFYRVERSEEHSGSGLGLTSARAAIEAHGGKIWADSLGPGAGSTFYFTLPFVPKASSFVQTHVVPSTTIELPVIEKTPARSALLKPDHRVRILLAESDARLTRYLRANLEEQQYHVSTVNHGVQFLRQLDLEEPDMILLSTRLSDMSGVELLQRLREFSQTPVILLSDQCDEDERVRLFDLGGDDLVIKPFSMKELLARVRALLRRHATSVEPANNQSIFRTGELVIDRAQHSVMVQGRPVQLSRTEYKLLNVLAQNVGMVVTHELLLEKVWGPEYNRDIDFIWVYISRLRRKIEIDSRRPQYILTVPDVGYKLAKL